MRYIWTETTIFRIPKKKPDDEALTGWTVLALIVAVIGGVANGWGGAAIGFLLVCFLYGILQPSDK